MKFETIKLNQLQPAEYNPRIITPDEQKRLAENLKEFGLVDPIIVNLKNNHIIGGHQRYNVLSKTSADKDFSMIRLGDIGWVFEDDKLSIKDDEHEKALNLALNKISGDWDYGKLTNILNELQVSNFNMDLTGFDDVELSTFNIDELIQIDNTLFDEESPQLRHDIDPSNGRREIREERTKEHLESGSEVLDEVMVSSDETNHYRCPKCGYEW